MKFVSNMMNFVITLMDFAIIEAMKEGDRGAKKVKLKVKPVDELRLEYDDLLIKFDRCRSGETGLHGQRR